MHRVRSTERLVRADVRRIFDVLADIRQHPLLDGSGTLRGAPEGPARLTLGSRFTMGMQQARIPYRSVSQVVEFEPDRRIAWRSTGEIAGRRVVGGQVWRYELEPRDGATLVRESYDWRGALLPRLTIELPGYPDRSERAMAATLERLARLVEQN